MKHPVTRFLVIALNVVLLAVLAASCVATPIPPYETPQPGATDTPEPISANPQEIIAYCADYSRRGIEKQAEIPESSTKGAEEAGVSADDLPQMKYPPFQDLMYVQRQVLLTGQADDIQKAIGTFDLQLERQDTPPIRLDEERAIWLATIADDRSVEDVTCLFNRFAQANPGLDVAADPNYYVSPAGWRGGGSPWTQNGFWASNQPGGGLGHAGPDQFMNQWALGSEGIDLLKEGSRLVEGTGEGVTIAVLDTAPWKRPCLAGFPCSQDVSWDKLTNGLLGNAEAGAPDMTVWEFGPADAATCPGPDRWNERLDRETQNINNHGLFAASLAHTVAPQSKVHLMRVLEDDGCGDLFKVLQGLQQFEDVMTAAASQPAGNEMPLTNTVVNLSLGVHQPDNADEMALPKEVTSLREKVQHMIGKGAVVVAASGNDSFSADPNATAATDADAPSRPEMPARDDNVIAVASSSYEQGRSCFSNSGTVAAPGGNGLTLDQVPPNRTLAAAAVAGNYVNCIVPGQVDQKQTGFWCEQPGNETTCVVGLGIDPARKSPTYLYWTGTSFATPLVSGIAALKLQQAVPPDMVDDEIYGHATPAASGAPFVGAGIANVNN